MYEKSFECYFNSKLEKFEKKQSMFHIIKNFVPESFKLQTAELEAQKLYIGSFPKVCLITGQRFFIFDNHDEFLSFLKAQN